MKKVLPPLIPFVVITLYAGLAQVPHDLVEAAEVDGARPWRIFLDVTFPILRPVLLILTSLSISCPRLRCATSRPASRR